MNKIPIGQRIGEIFEERDISVSQFVLRMRPVRVMSDTTLGRSIAGTRHLPPDELIDIADTLKLSVDRITQQDTEKEMALLEMLKRGNPRMALQIGTELLSVALGWSEKVDILNAMGTAHYYLKQFEKAHEAWLQAYEFAQKINWDVERLYKVVNNLILSYSVRSDFISMVNLIHRVDAKFHSRPELAGTLAYSHGIYAYDLKNYELYIQKMYESLEHFRKTKDEESMVIAIYNVAFAEYRVGNYRESVKLFESIIETIQWYDDYRFISLKSYCKVLVKLGEEEKALGLMQDILYELSTVEGQQEMRAKFLLLHAIVTDSVESAETVLTLEGISTNLYELAYRFCVNYCIKTGDSIRLTNYDTQAEKYSSALLFTLEEIG